MTTETTAVEYTYDDDTYSDLHKDVYGFRPRGEAYLAWTRMTDAEKQAEWDYLVRRLGEEVDRERIEQEEAAARFEARVTATIAAGAGDRETALRWIYDAECGEVPEGCQPDWDYLCFHVGVRYGYFKKAA